MFSRQVIGSRKREIVILDIILESVYIIVKATFEVTRSRDE